MTLLNRICKKCEGTQFYKSRGCKACDAVRVAKYRENNNEKIKSQKREIYALNPAKSLNLTKAWDVANPDSKRTRNRNRRAKKLLVGGILSKGIRQKLFILQKGKCCCCSLPLGADFHLDHILPLALGGPNIDSNIQLLRQRCNQQKHAKHPVDFMQSRGFLL